MKISIEEGGFNYSVDFSKIESGTEHPTVGEAIDYYLDLLASVYTREEIAKYLVENHLAAADYYKN